MFINTQSELDAFVQRAQHSSILAIDTEFLREKTYYARLCLLQLQTDTETVIVDPFAISNLKVLAGLLEHPDIMKLFHAGKQDIEILYHEVGVMPKPLFDTQIAAALLGHTQQIGYGNLVGAECGVQLAKVDSFTDWSRRPLSDSQITYAAEDVIYLPKLYERLSKQLESLGRTHWLDPDFAALCDEANYQEDSRERYRRLRRVGQLSHRQLSAARELAAWREDRAKELDLPRKWILTDEQIVEACKRSARTIDNLFMVRGVSEKLSMNDARAVVKCIRKGLDLDPSEWPELDHKGKNEMNVDVIVDVMNALVRLRARQNNIAFQTLASQSDIARVARGYTDAEILQGWRREIVGNELLELLHGKITLRINEGSLRVKHHSK